MNFAWLTDIHLEFLNEQKITDFFEKIAKQNLSGLFLTGDISNSYSLVTHLRLAEELINTQIYFVLGNHDYYGDSIGTTKKKVEELVKHSTKLFWLPQQGVVELSKDTCLIGHGGWADGRLGNYSKSTVILNDHIKIKDFLNHRGKNRLFLLNQLGDEAAEYLKRTLLMATDSYKRIILLTHVPPFREACWHNGNISDDNFLPHFACKAVGDELKIIMNKRPEKQLTVLCGHTHSAGHAQILSNLQVKTGGANYGAPEIQEVIQIDS